jgi:hypothetical protein
VKPQLKFIIFALIAIWMFNSCSNEGEIEVKPVTSEAVMNYLNSLWGDPLCTGYGCIYIHAIEARPSANDGIWCVKILNKLGTAFSDMNSQGINWDTVTTDEVCYYISTDDHGEIDYATAAK